MTTFLGIGALFGGGVFILSSSGKLFGMPSSLLDKSPFTDFLIPGIILFVVLGLIPCGLAIALMKKPASKWAERFNFFSDMHWAWTGSIYVAFALIIWIKIQMMSAKAVDWLHTFYMFLSIAILFVALLSSVRSMYKK